MILTTRGRGVKFPHRYRPSLIRRPEFMLAEETSILPPKLLDPRLYRILTHLTRCSKRPKCRTRRVTLAVLKNVKDITISKVFTIFNLLTFDGTKYMENGALCSGVASLTSSVSVADAPFPLSRAFGYVKEAQMGTLHDAHVLDAPMVA